MESLLGSSHHVESWRFFRVARKRKPRKRGAGKERRSEVNWYLMQPCIGIPRLGIPPFCSWKELNDGTYSLADVEIFHQAMGELLDAAEKGK